MNIRKMTLLFSLVLALLVGGLFFADTKHVSAEYNGALVIDNAVFLNKNAMSIAQIQSFLSSKQSGLASRSFVLQCYGAGSQERQLYNSVGAPCDQSIPASHIVYYASRIYDINPQVTLSMLQKEQSLITTQNPTSWQLNQAMGYGCPTTGNCSGDSTFSYQIDSGVWALRYHYERANGNNSWWSPSSSWVCGTEKNFYKPSLYPGQNVRFYDGNNVNYRTYYIENAATSALYCYTPHAYNNPEGLYGRPPFGSVGQYYSGSYNFVASFEEWFGSTRSTCLFPNAVNNGIYRLYNAGTGNHMLTSSPSEVCAATSIGWMYDGQMFMAEGSQGLPVFRLERGGRYLFTASVAERDSATSNYGFRLEGVAFYVTDPSVNPATARAVYRLASTNGAYVYTISDYERDQYISYGYRYEGIVFDLKENPGNTVTQAYRLSHPKGIYLYTIDSKERDIAVGSYGYRYEGVGFNAITQMNQITIPVYRLSSSNGYLLTTNLIERINAKGLGYRDEGIGMYTYGVNDSALPQLYRLSHPNGTYLFTTSTTEKNIAASSYGYRYEGVAFRTP